MVPPIDYLIIGHLSYDITPNGVRVGGTVSYAAVTAKAFNKSVGVVSSWGEEAELDIGELKNIPFFYTTSSRSTTFHNILSANGRKQILHYCANPIKTSDVPDEWRNTPLIHIAPIINEVPVEMITSCAPQFLGITPQGWFRSWNDDGIVHPIEWNSFLHSQSFIHLAYADAVVISDEDVGFEQSKIDDLANQCKLLVVTQGAKGANVYWQGKINHFEAPVVKEIDPVGAGDVFASTFFIHLHDTQDILYSAKVAVRIAAFSVTRAGQHSAPTHQEINSVLKE